MGVEVKFAGGIHADVRKMVAPLMGLVSGAASIVRGRVQRTGKGPKGTIFGKYMIRAAKSQKKTFYFWTPPDYPKSSAAIAVDALGRQLIPGWGAYQRGRYGGFKNRVAAGHNINFTLTGGMWDGLTAKMQKSGKRITVGFLGTSASKDKKTKYKSRNKVKAFYSSIGYAYQGNHILDLTDKEFEAFKDIFIMKSLSQIFKDAAQAQAFAKAAKARAAGDPKMKQKLMRVKSGGSGSRKIRAR